MRFANSIANWIDPSGLTCNQQPSPQDSFYCNPDNLLERARINFAKQALASYGVILTLENPAPECRGSSFYECIPGCWTATNAEIVLASVRAQATKISSVGGNFRSFLPSDGVSIMMARDGVEGFAALTPVPYVGTSEYLRGPSRIIIWRNGMQTWADGVTVIFSPQLMTHEFGHVLSVEWQGREKRLLGEGQLNDVFDRLLSYRFFNNYYGNLPTSISRGQPDHITINNQDVYLWRPFDSGAPSDNLRARGRFYDTRYNNPEELFAEAYAVWVHNQYANGLDIDPVTGLNIDELASVQRQFFERVFSGEYAPGVDIPPFPVP